MDGQLASVEVIRLVAQQAEKLGIHEGGHEIEGAVRVRQDDKKRRWPVSQGVQLQLITRHEIPQFRDVKGRETGPAANQDGFQSFARRYLEFAVLLDRKVIRLLLLQLGKQQIHGRLKLLVVLSGFAGVDEIQQGDEVALLRLRFVPE